MQSQASHRLFASALIAVGVALSFAAAVVPHYTAGYKVMAGVLLSGLLPYLAYGVLVPYLRGWVLSIPGIVVVALHAALIVRERFLDNADYSDGMIYVVPLALAVALLPLVFLALRQPWGAEPQSPARQPTDTPQQADL
jgi:hypothetical protein